MKAVLAIILTGLMFISTGQEKPKFAYHVCTTGALKTRCKVTDSTKTIDNIIQMYFPAIQIDTEKHFQYHNVIEVGDYDVIVYAEKKRIVKKKNGKIRLKKIR